MKISLYPESTHTALDGQNRKLSHVVGLILYVSSLVLGLGRMATAQSVHIPDPGLRAVLELALGKEAGADITQADMLSLESNIHNLTGLEWVELRLVRILDMSPLEGLKISTRSSP